MAHTKAQGAVKGNRDSRAKRLGVKIYGGQKAAKEILLPDKRELKSILAKAYQWEKIIRFISLIDGIVKFKKSKG